MTIVAVCNVATCIMLYNTFIEGIIYLIYSCSKRIIAPSTGWATAMAGRLDAIWIATLALSVGLVGIFITWKSSIKWITSFLVLFHWLLMFLQKFLCLFFILICFPLSCRLSAQFFPQLPHGCFACCCLNMLFIHIPLLRSKTLPAVCADLVNPWISRSISVYFSDVTLSGILGKLHIIPVIILKNKGCFVPVTADTVLLYKI